MLAVSSAANRDTFSVQVLKQMAWLKQELAKSEEKGLDLAELTSIRAAILKSLAELGTLYKAGLRNIAAGKGKQGNPD